jgi:hypothetical protein
MMGYILATINIFFEKRKILGTVSSDTEKIQRYIADIAKTVNIRALNAPTECWRRDAETSA